MTWKLVRLGALALLVLLPAALPAQTSIVVMGGVAAPVGRLGDITDLGYNLSAGVSVGGPTLPVGLRFEGGYNNFAFKGGNANLSIITGTANAIFNLGPQKDAPYLIAGLGVYNRGTGGYGDSKTAIGINGGGGLRFPLTGINTFFEARYHLMLGNGNDGTNFQFIPVMFGIQF